jgi:CRP/FNR family cyclic AMP-dependent transcriptional regulator
MTSIMTTSVLGDLIAASPTRTYKSGQTIFHQNDAQPHLYYIKSGAVTMEKTDDAGQRKVLYIHGQATLFPMVSFAEEMVSSSWSYVSLTTTEVYVIPYDDFAGRLRDASSFTVYTMLLKQMLGEVHELLQHITDHVKTDSTEKLISVLLFLLQHHTHPSNAAWRLVQFPVTHQLLADMTGLARETVSLSIKDLSSRKLVRYHGRGNMELHAAHITQHSSRDTVL